MISGSGRSYAFREHLPRIYVVLCPWPADSFSKYKTRDIPNKACIVVVHNLILNCVFRIYLFHLQQLLKTNQIDSKYTV